MPRRSTVPTGDIPYLHVKQIEAEAELLIAEYREHEWLGDAGHFIGLEKFTTLEFVVVGRAA